MREKLSRQDIDRVMSTVMADLSVDDKTLNEMADSPALWWGVQRRINVEHSAMRQPWPPSTWLRRWARITIPALAVLLIGAGIFIASRSNEVDPVVQVRLSPDDTRPVLIPESEIDDRTLEVSNTSEVKGVKIQSRRFLSIRHGNKRPDKNTAVVQTGRVPGAEVKSEFIALTYAERPESGHLVRVKVPSSMMVTLGLIASVDKPSSLVDAEVVVGEDGMTHSIRFIR